MQAHARVCEENKLELKLEELGKENDAYSLPDKVIAANSIGCFKSKLDKYWGQIGYGYEQRLTAYY